MAGEAGGGQFGDLLGSSDQINDVLLGKVVIGALVRFGGYLEMS